MNTRTFNANMLNDPFFIGFDRMLDRMTSTTLPTTSTTTQAIPVSFATGG